MPVKIRLMRIGARKRPFYRIVAVDERKKRTGGYHELLGTYNPLTEPKEIKLDQAKVDAWTKKGAQPSDGFLRIIGKAPQRPPRKPKKEKKGGTEAAPVASAPASEPASVEEKPQEETARTEEQTQEAVSATESQTEITPEAEKAPSETKTQEETEKTES